MKLRTFFLILAGVVSITSITHAANDAAQNQGRWRRFTQFMGQAWDSAKLNAQAFFNPMSLVDQDDVGPQAEQPHIEILEDEPARPFSERAQEVINNGVAQASSLINVGRQQLNAGRQQLNQAVQHRVMRAQAAIRENIREQFRSAIQEEMNDLQNNPQRQAEVVANVRNVAAAISQSPDVQQLRNDAINLARAQIPQVINGVAAEVSRPENIKAFENVAEQLMNSGKQSSVFNRVRDSFMESTRTVRWSLASLGALGSLFFAYKVGVWLKNKFWGPAATLASLPVNAFNGQANPNAASFEEPQPAHSDDATVLTDAIARHQSFLNSTRSPMSAKVRALAQGQLAILQQAQKNRAVLNNLKNDLGDLEKALA